MVDFCKYLPEHKRETWFGLCALFLQRRIMIGILYAHIYV